MKTLIQGIIPHYRAIRQKIHQHPELRYEEVQTAALIQHELIQLGLKPQAHIGKTGVVAILDSGKPGKTVALRADMDALPIVEQNTFAYQSQHKGIMHACGHDGHVATLLGVANILSQQKDKLHGKVKFIFQPAEEGGAGALAMINDGVLDNPPVDAIFGYHNYPGLKSGYVQARSGCTMYSNTEFFIEIHGKGGHAAMPEMANNPIPLAASLIQALSQISETLAKQEEHTVLSMTTLHAGKASNVIPEIVRLGGTIRAPSLEAANTATALIQAHIDNQNKESPNTLSVEFNNIYPPTINTQRETDFVLNQAKKLLGEEQVFIKEKSARASEDFSYFLQKVPGCYFFIGNGIESASCHHPAYNFNDEILPVAIELLSTITIAYLSSDV